MATKVVLLENKVKNKVDFAKFIVCCLKLKRMGGTWIISIIRLFTSNPHPSPLPEGEGTKLSGETLNHLKTANESD